jgi:hypothetical protein
LSHSGQLKAEPIMPAPTIVMTAIFSFLPEFPAIITVSFFPL